jgi:hypothetical protein
VIAVDSLGGFQGQALLWPHGEKTLEADRLQHAINVIPSVKLKLRTLRVHLENDL